MRSTRPMSITLPMDMAQMVKDKVAGGEYATESEVIRDGLRALMARDRAVDAWLKSQAAPACGAMASDPERGVSPAQVRARLAAKQDVERRLQDAGSEALRPGSCAYKKTR